MQCILKQRFLIAALVIALGGGSSTASAQKGYRLAAGDVLGVFVEGVIGEFDSTPPVQIPAPESDLPPSIGFPTVVRQNGTLSLPLVKPIQVSGLKIEQAEQTIQRAYRAGSNPIVSANARIIVTLARKRTVQVTVIRQDAISTRPLNFRGGVTDRSDSSSRGNRLQLPAGDNDLLTALIQTGGIPGLNAKSYIRISREKPAGSSPARQRNSGPSELRSVRGSHFPRTNRTGGQRSTISTKPPRTTHNHSSFYRGYEAPQRTEFLVPVSKQTEQNGARLRRLKLHDGDIVQVDARPTEVYYTGGLLAGGEFPLPRDKRLDVLEAVALAGGQVGNNGGVAAGSVPPTELLVVRKLPNGSQQTFRVDLDRAVTDARHRPTVAAGDTLILRYQPVERAANVGIQALNTFGTRQIFGQ